jgi:hypothetical protein
MISFIGTPLAQNNSAPMMDAPSLAKALAQTGAPMALAQWRINGAMSHF